MTGLPFEETYLSYYQSHKTMESKDVYLRFTRNLRIRSD